MHIRPYAPGDEHAVAEIYNPYILRTDVTFEEVALSAEQMGSRISDVLRRYPWLVAEDEGQVVGYAYASPWKARAAYRHTAEVSVYVRQGCTGRGLGQALYTALFEALSQADVHVLLACIALPHEDSVRLHERFGFSKIGHFTEVGRKFDRWIDVGYWQKVLKPA